MQRKSFLHTEESQTTFPTFPNRNRVASQPPAAEVILLSRGWEVLNYISQNSQSPSLPSQSGSKETGLNLEI